MIHQSCWCGDLWLITFQTVTSAHHNSTALCSKHTTSKCRHLGGDENVNKTKLNIYCGKKRQWSGWRKRGRKRERESKRTSIDETSEKERGLCFDKSHATPRPLLAISVPRVPPCLHRETSKASAHTLHSLHAYVSSWQTSSFMSAGLPDSCGRKPGWNMCCRCPGAPPHSSLHVQRSNNVVGERTLLRVRNLLCHFP